MKHKLVVTLSLATLLVAGPVFAQTPETGEDTEGGISGMMQSLEGMAPDMMGEMREMIEGLDPSQIRDVHRLMRDIDVERMREVHQAMQELDIDRIRRMQEQMDRIEPLLGRIEDVDVDRLRRMTERMAESGRERGPESGAGRNGERDGDRDRDRDRNWRHDSDWMMGQHMSGGAMMRPPALTHFAPGLLYGLGGPALPEPLEVEDVEDMLESLIDRHGNPRLALGALEETDTGEIIADIETVDGSLVQRLGIDQHTGTMRQVR